MTKQSPNINQLVQEIMKIREDRQNWYKTKAMLQSLVFSCIVSFIVQIFNGSFSLWIAALNVMLYILAYTYFRHSLQLKHESLFSSDIDEVVQKITNDYHHQFFMKEAIEMKIFENETKYLQSEIDKISHEVTTMEEEQNARIMDAAWNGLTNADKSNIMKNLEKRM